MYKNEQINESLEQLSTTLQAIQLFSSDTTPEDAKKHLKDLTRQSQLLKKALESNPGLHYEYEFYEEGAFCVARVSECRIDADLYALLHRLELWSALNNLVDIIAKGIFLHESLKAYADVMRKLKALDKFELPELREYVALVNATTDKIRVLADKGVEKTEQVNEELQKAQKRSGGILPEKLIQKAMTVTLTMYAKNAAAMVATDRKFAVEDAFIARQDHVSDD